MTDPTDSRPTEPVTGGRFAVGIDVGGRSVKGALVDDAGRIAFRTSALTPAGSTDPNVILDVILGVAREVQSFAGGRGAPLVGFGFGLPTYTVGEDWLLTNCINVPALEGVHLRPLLTAEFGEVVYCDMDTNAATIAELHLGGGRDHDRVLVAVLGTGISCGVAIGGRLLRYSFGTAGDLGHLIVETVSGVRCACGGTGCLETVATAGGIERLFRQAPRDQGSAESPALTYDPGPDFPAILEAARSGDLVARAVLSTAGRYLGFALASMVNIYSPQIILVGGGIAEAGDLLLRSARETVADAASAYHLAYLAGINQCALRADAGVVGAAALVLFGS